MLVSSKFVYLIVAVFLLLVGPFLWWAYNKRVHQSLNSIKDSYQEVWFSLIVGFVILTKTFWLSSLKEKGMFLLLSIIMWISSFFIVWLVKGWLDFIPPYVIVVKDGNGKVDYDEYLCIGTYTYPNGVIVGGQLGKTDIVNMSSFNIRYYSVHYAQRSSTANYWSNHDTTIKPHEHKKVEHYPDYRFRNPPSSKRSIWGGETCWIIDVER